MSRGCGFSFLCLSQQLQSESSLTLGVCTLWLCSSVTAGLAERQVLPLRYPLWMGGGRALSLQIEHKCIVSPYLWDELLLYQPCDTPYLFPCALAMSSRACQSSGCCPTQELRCQPGASDILGSFSAFKLLSSGQVLPCELQAQGLL